MLPCSVRLVSEQSCLAPKEAATYSATCAMRSRTVRHSLAQVCQQAAPALPTLFVQSPSIFTHVRRNFFGRLRRVRRQERMPVARQNCYHA